jgi:hypothetical protein
MNRAVEGIKWRLWCGHGVMIAQRQQSEGPVAGLALEQMLNAVKSCLLLLSRPDSCPACSSGCSDPRNACRGNASLRLSARARILFRLYTGPSRALCDRNTPASCGGHATWLQRLRGASVERSQSRDSGVQAVSFLLEFVNNRI